MRTYWILLCCILFPLNIWGQQQTEYNKKGDDALRRKDFRDAKMWFEEGVSYCDAYSIDKLTMIWLQNEEMRPSMRSLMNKCLNCLNVRGTEKDTTAIHQLIVYYQKGIGASKSEELADYWKNKLIQLRKPVEYISNTSEDRYIPKRMDFFVGYNYAIEAPFGLTIGGVGRYIGWYARFKTNMAFDEYTSECTNQHGGELIGLDSDKTYYFTNEKKKNSYAVTGGLVVKCTNWLYTSLGFGYGKRTMLYEYKTVDPQTAIDVDTGWAKHLDASYNGVAADLDVMLKFGPVFFSGGCSTINFKYVDLNAGLGVFF